MRKPLAVLLLAAGSALTGTGVQAVGSFEEVGLIEALDPRQQLVTVDGRTYRLPAQIQLDGLPAISRLRSGRLIGFSGVQQRPYPLIESLYLYPNQAEPQP